MFASVLVSLLCGLGCEAHDSSASGGEQSLRELERAAFLPAGRVRLESFLVRVVLYENVEPLLVDRYEVTRAQWRAFADAQPDSLAELQREHMQAWTPEAEDRPATFMTLDEARAYAQWRGMRLLTASEWLFCALGPERRQYPWDVYERRDSVANTLELGLERASPVGTFESGRTPRGLYDMLGNVAEWVSDDVELRGARAEASDEPSFVSALGGSFRTWSRPIFRPVTAGDSGEQPFLAFRLPPASRQDDVGLRCAVGASAFLWDQAPRWPSDKASRARLEAVGRGWGRAALPLLNELCARPAAPPGLSALRAGAER